MINPPARLIEGFRIRNYRVLKDVVLGRIVPRPHSTDAVYTMEEIRPGKPLTPLTVVIGKNGFGKSTLFDAFGFLVDCAALGTESACDRRGGFDTILSQGTERQLEFKIRYGELLYTLCIAADEGGIPYVFAETLTHLEPREKGVQQLNFFVNEGQGKIVRSGSEIVGSIHLADSRRPALSTLGNLSEYPDIVEFKRFLDSWYLCYFSPDAARQSPASGPQKHLSTSGDNLANVVRYMEREHKDRFDTIMSRVASRIPGVDTIHTKTTEDGRLLLCFQNRGFDRPFYASQVSDGTLKMFAYMLLLHDPGPAPFICFEEPENGLYHRLMEVLIDEIRDHLARQNGSQFFITTHQPYLVDALAPEEVWILERGTDGFAQIRRACDDPIVRGMVEQGMPLGALWFSEYLDTL
ncbi:MAG TPA: ATPase [Planctomycetaceae bacterium]|nr:ATPase [Planctomycetaceae bacterium]